MPRRLLSGLFLLPLLVAPLSGQQNYQSNSTASVPNGIAIREIHVPAANDEWTSTGFRVSSGDCLMFSADTTRIRIGAGGGEVNALGNSVGTGALRAKIGTNSPITVGLRYWFCSKEQGLLKLKVADTRYDDNSGEFTAYVIRVPGQMLPPVEKYQEEN